MVCAKPAKPANPLPRQWEREGPAKWEGEGSLVAGHSKTSPFPVGWPRR